MPDAAFNIDLIDTAERAIERAMMLTDAKKYPYLTYLLEMAYLEAGGLDCEEASRTSLSSKT